MAQNDGVHATHCCSRHGCKYGYRYDEVTKDWIEGDCPVEKGRVEQEYLCERCIDPQEAREQLKWLLDEI